VLILVRTDVYASGIKYDFTDVCTVEFQGKTSSRILGIYAPTSRSWPWEHPSQYMSRLNVVFVDFNVDLEPGKEKASRLLIWADEIMLARFTLNKATSLRSDRMMDYTFSNDPVITLTRH
jgi:hypothetical protein